MAVALSGFSGDSYVFAGFLPVGAGARQKEIKKLIAYALPVVLFESPYRMLNFMKELNNLVPEREIFIGRELTKLNEESLYGTVKGVADLLVERQCNNCNKKLKGEFVIVLAGA
jgi:16S rRNA (cytidine1402-2'-O)-methyltransferase